MIYAKTGMERMPERCESCLMHSGRGNLHVCGQYRGRFAGVYRIERAIGQSKPDWCPLTEIETEDEKHAGDE